MLSQAMTTSTQSYTLVSLALRSTILVLLVAFLSSSSSSSFATKIEKQDRKAQPEVNASISGLNVQTQMDADWCSKDSFWGELCKLCSSSILSEAHALQTTDCCSSKAMRNACYNCIASESECNLPGFSIGRSSLDASDTADHRSDTAEELESEALEMELEGHQDKEEDFENEDEGHEEDEEEEFGEEKRARGFLGKRARGFLGKRARGFLGKRARGFLGKRARGFLGKRARGFLG